MHFKPLMFPDEKCLLPPTLTSIVISKLNNLESLSTELQNLTSLEGLEVHDCPKLHEECLQNLENFVPETVNFYNNA
ncbi:hypothetical protein SLE2022_024660 [Rubroshorea leprosula]